MMTVHLNESQSVEFYTVVRMKWSGRGREENGENIMII